MKRLIRILLLTCSLFAMAAAQAQGITWTSRTSAADNDWRSVTFGNGLFVATAITGTGNRVMTSPDGITWTSRTPAADNDWRGVTFSNGLFVAVAGTGTGNRVMTSPDGINWTSRTSAADNTWSAVTFANGLFVAVAFSGTGNRVMTSPDGINWTIRTSAADNQWLGLTFANGLFVAVANTGTGNRVMTSPDGITWTSRTSAADNSWRSVTFGNGLFVAVSADATGNRVMTSPDGITWTIRTPAADNQWIGVTFGNGLFVAVAATGAGNRVMTSPDGIAWTSRTSAADNVWRSVTFSNGLFVAVAESGSGNRVMTSGTLVVTPAVVPTPNPSGAIAATISGSVSESGTSATITLTLTQGTPTANVVIPVVSANTSEVVVSAPSVTFVPGGPTSQTVSVTGVDDGVIDGDQTVLIRIGPAQSTGSYNNFKPNDVSVINRESGVGLPSLPFAGGILSGFVDITNAGSSVISRIDARVYDTLGILKGSGTVAQNLAGKGNVSIGMQALQAALGVSGVSANDHARIELFPVGGNILAQSRITNGVDTYNVSAAGRRDSAGIQSTAGTDSVKLRITNLTNQSQEGRGTLYRADGTALGPVNALLFAGLQPRSTIEFTAFTLQTTLGITPWANRAWLKMSDPTSFAIQVLNSSAGVRTLSAVPNQNASQTLNYFLPSGDANVVSMVRIYNNERYAAQFDGQLYAADGTRLAVFPLGLIPARGILTMTNSQLRALPGVPAWIGAARLKIVSDLTSFQAQGSLRNQGFLTDTTNVITDGIITHLPDSTENLDIELNIVNPGTQTTTITGTLHNSAGLVIGAANFALGSVAANASSTVTRANLETLAGPWTGRATLTIASSTGGVEVLALLRNRATGALTNLSERPLR